MSAELPAVKVSVIVFRGGGCFFFPFLFSFCAPLTHNSVLDKTKTTNCVLCDDMTMTVSFSGQRYDAVVHADQQVGI